MNNQIKIRKKQSVSRNLWLDKIRGELFQAELVLASGLGDVHLAVRGRLFVHVFTVMVRLGTRTPLSFIPS